MKNSSFPWVRGACVVWVLVLAGCGGSSGDQGGGAGSAAGSGGANQAQGQGGASGSAGNSGAGAASNSGAGASGASGAGGAAAGAGGSAGQGGVSSTALSRYDACIAYARTIENRLYRDCVGAPLLGPDEHALREVDCPDLLFADGSNRTIDDVMRCEEQWRTAPCDELLGRVLPDCMPYGSLPLATGCMFNVQCASGRCGGAADAAGCKRCVEEAAVGASCVEPSVQCPSDAPCDGQACTQFTSTPITGGECGEGKPCPEGSVCRATAPGVLECAALALRNEACDGVPCADGLACSPTSSLCELLPTVGQPCPRGNCAADAFCRDGFVFDPAPMQLPPVCMARLARGEVCSMGSTDDETGNGSCAVDLTCACDDDACSSAHCIEQLYAGEACGAPSSACVQGTACVAGTCQGVDSQGLADACP